MSRMLGVDPANMTVVRKPRFTVGDSASAFSTEPITPVPAKGPVERDSRPRSAPGEAPVLASRMPGAQRRRERDVGAVPARVGHELEPRDDVVAAAERAEALVFGGGGQGPVGPFAPGDVDGAAADETLRQKRQSARVVSMSPPTCSISV